MTGNRKKYPQYVILDALDLLDKGLAYATVRRVIQAKYPIEASALQHGAVVSWNKRFRASEPPTMYKMHYDPVVFVDAIELVEQGHTVRMVSKIIEDRYKVKVSYATIALWGKAYADTNNSRTPRNSHKTLLTPSRNWRLKIKEDAIKAAVECFTNESELWAKLERLKEKKTFLDLEITLVEAKLVKVRNKNDPLEMMVAP